MQEDQSKSVVTDDAEPPSSWAELTTEIVSAYVSHNKVAASDLATLITTLASQLAKIGTEVESPAEEKSEPAVPVRRSIRPDHLLCLVCGKPHKVLKRHLAVQHELTPAELPGALRAQARLSNGGSQLPPAPVGGGARDWPGAAEEAGSSWKEGGRTLTDGRTKPAAGDDAGV